MIHSDHEDGISRTALDQSRPLLQRHQAGHAGDGNALHRAARAVCCGEIRRQEITLQMAPCPV